MSRPTLSPSEASAALPHQPFPFSYQWPPPAPPRSWRWALVGVTALLWVAVVSMGVYLLWGAGPVEGKPTPQPRINVPYRDRTEVWDGLRDWVVQEDGRTKPFDTFCRETVRTITGRERFEDNDPVAVVASWLLLYEPDVNRAAQVARRHGCDWEQHPFLLCEDRELRRRLYEAYLGEGMPLTAEQAGGKHIEPVVVRHSPVMKSLLLSAAGREAEDANARPAPLEKKAQELKKRLALYDRVRAGGHEGKASVHAPGEMGAVVLDRHGAAWFSLRSVRDYAREPAQWQEAMRFRRLENPSAYAGQPEQPLPAAEIKEVQASFQALQRAYRSEDATGFAGALADLRQTIARVSGRYSEYPTPESAQTELWYNRSEPFRKAWLASLIAAVLLTLALACRERWHWLGRLLYLAGLLGSLGSLGWATAGFACRVWITGRPPVSNMYESILWAAFMAGVLGLVLEGWHRRGVLALAGALTSTLGLLLADLSPLTLSPSLQPLQAVLRSNYWLVVHVLTIVSSYAAFGLGWGLGNFTLGVLVFAPQRTDLVKSLAHLCYRSIQVGVVLLAAGTLLGGFWAAESWGRFWGWDPKEVWALIALLCYLIPLHARYVGWVKERGLALASVLCFGSVVMAWYGVNFILGAGLHSYGFGGADDLWLYWAVLLNLALVSLALTREQRLSCPAVQ